MKNIDPGESVSFDEYFPYGRFVFFCHLPTTFTLDLTMRRTDLANILMEIYGYKWENGKKNWRPRWCAARLTSCQPI